MEVYCSTLQYILGIEYRSIARFAACCSRLPWQRVLVRGFFRDAAEFVLDGDPAVRVPEAQHVTESARARGLVLVAPSLVEPRGTAEPTQIHSEADEGAKGVMMVDSPPHQPHTKKKKKKERKKRSSSYSPNINRRRINFLAVQISRYEIHPQM